VSDTPRTDAAIWDEYDPASAVGELCHKLERELNRVIAERDHLLNQRHELTKSPWKSVDEPPRKSGYKFIAVDKNGNHDIAEFDRDENRWQSERGFDLNPTHWTEIPDLCL